MNEIETYEALSRGEKVSRKDKLVWLGRKLSKKKIKSKIKAWKTKEEEDKKHSYFCPNCGLGTGYLHDHEVEYPERWIDEYCLRCHTKTAWTDNSPWRFALSEVKL